MPAAAKSFALLNAIYYDTKWRDQSIPSKYWDEFALDGKTVLALLREKQNVLPFSADCRSAHPEPDAIAHKTPQWDLKRKPQEHN